jgi:hypothetical protein
MKRWQKIKAFLLLKTWQEKAIFLLGACVPNQLLFKLLIGNAPISVVMTIIITVPITIIPGYGAVALYWWLKAKLLRRQHIRWLRDLLENYSDEIPEQEILGRGHHYKVQGTWLHKFVKGIQDAIRNFNVPESTLTKDCQTFIRNLIQRRADWVQLVLSHKNTEKWLPTTREEIDGANDLLRRMIEELRGKRRGK